MSECCGPADGVRERVSPELMQQIRDRNQRKDERRASERGLTMEEYYNTDKLVSPINRLRAWFKKAKLDFQLWLP